MGYASRSGRARVSSRNPQAFGVCDRCAMWYNHADLRWQYDWAGASLINKRLLVCDTCYDEPQEQLRSIALPADPVPIVNPRTEPYLYDNTSYRQVSGFNTVNQQTGIPVPGGAQRVTTSGGQPTSNNRVVQQTGAPNGSLNELPGTDPNAVTYRPISGVANNGIGQIRVTVNTTNGMITNQKVIVQRVEGVPNANGQFVITVVDGTHIDLQNTVFTGSYISGGYVINDPSLPRGTEEIPQTGPL